MLLRSGRAAACCCSLALMIVGTACGSATGPVEPSTGARAGAGAIRRIAVLGDSLAVSPSRTDAFPARLQERLDAAYPGWIVGNEGVGGDTTSDGLQRLDRALPDGTAILILELGANDGLRGAPIDTIEANLSAIIDNIPYVATMSPIVADLVAASGDDRSQVLWWALALALISAAMRQRWAHQPTSSSWDSPRVPGDRSASGRSPSTASSSPP